MHFEVRNNTMWKHHLSTDSLGQIWLPHVTSLSLGDIKLLEYSVILKFCIIILYIPYSVIKMIK